MHAIYQAFTIVNIVNVKIGSIRHSSILGSSREVRVPVCQLSIPVLRAYLIDLQIYCFQLLPELFQNVWKSLGKITKPIINQSIVVKVVSISNGA